MSIYIFIIYYFRAIPHHKLKMTGRQGSHTMLKRPAECLNAVKAETKLSAAQLSDSHVHST